LPNGPITIMCAHGERAMTAASVLARAGHIDLGVLASAGPDEWAEVTGDVLETGW
jgi:hydroxyacylglutathione hydrolase